MFRFGPDDAPKLPVPPSRRQVDIARAVLAEHLTDEVLREQAEVVEALARTGISPEEIRRRWQAAGL